MKSPRYAKVSVLWKFEPPAGAGDTHDSLMRGTKCSLHIRQGAGQGYKPALFIEHVAKPDDTWRAALASAITQIDKSYPGVAVKEHDGRWEVVIPERYKVGHEAHFGQVTSEFLGYLQGKPVPAWELPNTLVKYRTIMDAWRMSR